MIQVTAHMHIWLCHKRLSKGRFYWRFGSTVSRVCTLDAQQLQQLLWNIDPLKTASQNFRPILSERAGHKQNYLL